MEYYQARVEWEQDETEPLTMEDAERGHLECGWALAVSSRVDVPEGVPVERAWMWCRFARREVELCLFGDGRWIYFPPDASAEAPFSVGKYRVTDQEDDDDDVLTEMVARERLRPGMLIRCGFYGVTVVVDGVAPEVHGYPCMRLRNLGAADAVDWLSYDEERVVLGARERVHLK